MRARRLRWHNSKEKRVTTDYAVRDEWVQKVLKELECDTPTVDAFATKENARVPRCWTEENDAFKQDWSKEKLLWLNPPFDNFEKVINKLKEDRAQAVLILPRLEYRDWWTDLEDITVRV